MKVIMYPAITLDGYIADNDGDCYSWISDEDEVGYTALMRQCGCDIVGRKTYEQYKEDYDNRRDIVTFVCTKTPANFIDTEHLKFVIGSPEEVLETVASYGFKEVVLSGGGQINGQFAMAECIDEIIISIYGLTLGAGISLFGGYVPKLQLKLLSTNNNVAGVVQNHYQVIKTSKELSA